MVPDPRVVPLFLFYLLSKARLILPRSRVQAVAKKLFLMREQQPGEQLFARKKWVGGVGWEGG